LKKCPFCAEDIQDAAIICKHCQRNLPSSVAKGSAAPIAGIVLDEQLEERQEPTRGAIARPAKADWVRNLFVVISASAAILSATLVYIGVFQTDPSDRVSPTATTSSRQPAVPPRQESTTEYKLAVLNHGGYVPPDDITVSRFRFLLGQLASKFGETPERIANMSVKARNSLAEKGVSETLLNIMEGMNQIVDRPGTYGKDPYANFLTLYVVLRTTGKTHEYAVNNLRGVIRELGLR